MKLAGVVTLYHPSNDVITNIESYIEQLDVLYVLDNTEEPSEHKSNICAISDKIKYVAFCDNMGISYAMNYALNLAKDYDFILTMDQDSSFAPGMMEHYKQAINEFEMTHPNKVGVYSVNYIPSVDPVVPGHKIIDVAITSGSVIPVQASIEIGGFDEKLFIDLVDDEFCHRVKKSNLAIIEFPSITLNHSLGAPKPCHILGFHYTALNHNVLRKYYMARNKIYVLKKYPELSAFYIERLFIDTIKVLLAEDDKIDKLKYIFKGIKDGITNNMGRLAQ